jgi:excisionase family DNA binding protein
MTPSPTASTRIPLLYTVQEVAELLHVHPQTVRDYHRSGELGFVRSGKRHLTRDDQLAKFIDDRSD